MHPAEINAAIKKAGTSQTAIAEALQVTPATISGVVNNRLKSKRVQEAIALVINMSRTQVWPKDQSRQEKKDRALQRARAAIGTSAKMRRAA